MFGILLSLGLFYYVIPALILEEYRKKANKIHWSQVKRSCNKYPYTCPVDKKEEPKPEPKLVPEPEETPQEQEKDEPAPAPVLTPLQEWVNKNADYVIDLLEGKDESVTIPSDKLTGYDPEEIINWLMGRDNVSLAMYDEDDKCIHLAICDASRM